MRYKTLKKLCKLIHSLKGFKDLEKIECILNEGVEYVVLTFVDEYFSVDVTGLSEVGAIIKVMELLNKISS